MQCKQQMHDQLSTEGSTVNMNCVNKTKITKKKNFRKRKQNKEDIIKVEIDVEGLEVTKQEIIANLASKLNLEQEDVLSAYDTFLDENPSGFISKEKFLEEEKVSFNGIFIQYRQFPNRINFSKFILRLLRLSII